MGYRNYKDTITKKRTNESQLNITSLGYRQYKEQLKERNVEIKKKISNNKQQWTKEWGNAMFPTYNFKTGTYELPKIAPIPAKEPTVFYNQIKPLQEDVQETTRLKKAMDDAKYKYDNAANYGIVAKVANLDWTSPEKDFAKEQYEKAKDEYYKHMYGVSNKQERQELLNNFIATKDQLEGEERTRMESAIEDLKKSIYGDHVIDDYLIKGYKKAEGDFNVNTVATLDATVGNLCKLFGWKDNPVSKLYSWTLSNQKYFNEESSNAASAMGDKLNIGGNVISGLIGLIPDLMLLYATKGSSAPTSTTLKSISNIATASKTAKFSTKVMTSANTLFKNTAKNPMFWSSFTRTFGGDYKEAINNGASEGAAYMYAILTSSMNSLVEISGGVQALPSKLKDKTKSQILNMVISAVEEGEEEVIQGIISEINEKLLYDFDKPFYSDTDENAVINPKRMATEAAVGTAVGIIAGGGQITASNILNSSKQHADIGKNVKKFFDAKDIISYASKSLNEEIRNLAQANSKGKILNKDLGVLYSYVVRDIDAQFQSANNIEQLNSILSQFTNNNTSQTMNNIVFSRFINRLESIDGELAAEYNENGILKANTNNDVDSYNINRSDNNAGQNPGILAGSGISTVSGSGNSLRQQGENTRTLSGYLGDIHEGESNNAANRRAGESGWLSKGANRPTQAQSNRYDKGILRSLQRVALKKTDSAGRTLGDKVHEDLKDTVLKNEDGTVVSLFHWTAEVFDIFKFGDIGFHLGTLLSARDRYEENKKQDPNTPIGVYKEAYVRLESPVFMTDLGSWAPSYVAIQLLTDGIITNAQYAEWERLSGFEAEDYNSEASVAVREFLKKQGYDGILYNNQSEDIGSISVIVFDADQIITVAENGVLKENSGVTEADSDESAYFSPENSDPGITELSAENPKYDMIEDIGAQMARTVRKTDQQRLLVKIGKAFGVPVRFANLDETIVDESGNEKLFSPDGEFNEDTGVITLNTSTVVKHQPIKFVLKHELVHFGNTNKDAYKRFVNAVKDSKVFKAWLQQKTNMQGATTDAMLAKLNNDVRQQRARAGKPIGPQVALEEIIADFSGDVLFEKSGKPITALIESLQKPQRPLVLQYVVNAFEHLIGKLKGTNDGLTLELRNLQSNYVHMLKQAQKNTATQNSSGVKNSVNNIPTIALSDDNELSKRIDSSSDNKYDVIKNYIFELLGDRDIQLSDGRTAIVDKRDVQHISHHASNKKIAEISKIKEIIEKAVLVAEETKVEHNKFDYFGYYSVNVTYKDVPFQLFLNVGKSKYDGQYHIYDITDKRKTGDVANHNSDLLRPVGNAITNNISKHSIPNSDENVKKYSVATEPTDTTDYTAEMDALYEQFRSGEIDREDYIAKVNELYEKAGETYGTIKKGEKVTGNENFDDPTPQKVNKDQKVRRHVRTIIEGGGLTDEMLTVTKEQILSGDVSYTPTSNEKNLKYAEKAISNGSAKGIWKKAANGEEKPSGAVVAIGEALLKNAIDGKDTAQVVKLTAELSEMATRLGQATQAFSLLKRMDGISQLYYVQKTVDRLNHDLSKKHGKQQITVTINPELALQLAESKTKGDFDVSYGAIMRDIAAQVPATFIDKYNSWRYMSMLLSPTTHIRNIVGNAIFCPAIKIKDTIAALTESATGISTDKRTKAVIVGKEYKNFAKDDFVNVEEIITGGGKMNPKSSILDERTIFNNKVLENARKFNFDMLEKEDAIFLKGHYVRALSGYLQAQKVDLKNIPDTVLAKARDYAILEAQKATYRDASSLANILSNFSRKNAVSNILTESALPFKKTPINIVKRSIEYSPIGLLKTISKGLYDLKTGNITSAQFIDGFAAGVTGTAVMAVGMALASLGIVRGGFDDEDDAWFDKLMGHQEYSVEIGGVSYTIDFAAPAVIPFFMGVSVMEGLKKDDNTNTFYTVANAIGNALEPIVNLSMLSGIQNTISTTRYASSDGSIQSILTNMVNSYFSQVLPTLGGKINNVIDPVRRTNYIDKTSPLPIWVQSALNILGSKVPGLSYFKAPYVDAWGNKQYKGGFIERVFQNFLSPGYLSDVETSAVADEIKRLAKETGEDSVYPGTPPKYIKFKGLTKHLTAEEYTQYAIDKGQMQADYIQEAINSAKYKKLTDEQKVKVITNLYKYANAKAKANLSYSFDEINAMHDGNIKQSKFSSYKDQTKKGLVVDYFLDDYKKPYSSERNGGSAVDYFINKAKQ